MDKPFALSHDEAQKRVKVFYFVTIALVILLATGTIFYHFVEGWSWIDSTYFSVITLATVGYGDFAPQTDIGKIFTIFYIIIGLGIFATFVSNLLRNQVAKKSLRNEAHAEATAINKK